MAGEICRFPILIIIIIIDVDIFYVLSRGGGLDISLPPTTPTFILGRVETELIAKIDVVGSLACVLPA